MTNDELTGLLEDLAMKDLYEGADVYDHPCSVAIREIYKLRQCLSRIAEHTEVGNNDAPHKRLAKQALEGEGEKP